MSAAHFMSIGAILDYEDVSEFYWQVIGDDVNRPTGRVLVNVHLPEPLKSVEQVLIYGHGPLSGQSKIIDLQTFRFEATDVPAHQFVEIRIVWPKGLVRGFRLRVMTERRLNRKKPDMSTKPSGK